MLYMLCWQCSGKRRKMSINNSRLIWYLLGSFLLLNKGINLKIDDDQLKFSQDHQENLDSNKLLERFKDYSQGKNIQPLKINSFMDIEHSNQCMGIFFSI